MIAATVVPSAGRMPMNVPMPQERRIVPRQRRKSSRLGSLTATERMRSRVTSSICDWLSISPIANRPISTGTKSMPS